jgi:hypothetical protein
MQGYALSSHIHLKYIRLQSLLLCKISSLAENPPLANDVYTSGNWMFIAGETSHHVARNERVCFKRVS